MGSEQIDGQKDRQIARKTNRLAKFNVDKTKIMLFGKASKSVSSLACVELDGKAIEFVDKSKYLGFYVVSATLSIQEDLGGFFWFS